MSQTVDRAPSILPPLAEGPAGLEQVATRLEGVCGRVRPGAQRRRLRRRTAAPAPADPP